MFLYQLLAILFRRTSVSASVFTPSVTTWALPNTPSCRRWFTAYTLPRRPGHAACPHVLTPSPSSTWTRRVSSPIASATGTWWWPSVAVAEHPFHLHQYFNKMMMLSSLQTMILFWVVSLPILILSHTNLTSTVCAVCAILETKPAPS